MSASANKTVTFIIIDSSSNTFSISGMVGAYSSQLQGTSSPIDLMVNQWDSFSINNNGTDFFIK